MKIETSSVLVLDSITASRSKSYTFLYNNIQKAKQKGIQKAPNVNITRIQCLCPKQQMQQIIQFVQTYNKYQLKNKTN